MAVSEEQYIETANQALEHWDIDVARIKLASRSENVVFKVHAGDGQGYALRLHRPGYNSLDELNSEVQWAEALTESGINVPPHVANRSGGHYLQTTLAGSDQELQVGLIVWVAGEQLATLIEDAEPARLTDYFEQLGAIIADTHNQATAWDAPPGFVRRHWDADGLIGENPLWGKFWEASYLDTHEAELLYETRTRVHHTLTQLGEPAHEFSLTHADLHPHNVLVDGDTVQIIDFDDCGYGWHGYDIAIALYDYKDDANFAQIKNALVAGYRRRRELSDAVVDLLDVFFLVRSLISLGWINARPELVDEEFIAKRAKRTCHHAKSYLEKY